MREQVSYLKEDQMFRCPNCGGDVPDNARACPHCGSDEETGWNPDADYLSVDIPDEENELEHTASSPVSTPFAVFLVIIIILGIIAFSRSFFSLIGVLALAAAVLFYRKRSSGHRP